MLDQPTLLVAFGVAALTLLFLSYFVIFRVARTPYSAWWCIALVFFLAGAAVLILDGTGHRVWATPLGNALLVSGAAAVWTGSRSLRAPQPAAWLLAAGPVIAAVASAVDNPATNKWPGDAVFFALMSLIFALASREQWLLEPGYSRIRFPMAISSGFLGAYYLCRLAAFLTDGPTGSVYGRYFSSEMTALITMALLLVASFSMASLSNEQLTQDLRALATHDGLTGLLNRSAFLELAAVELRRLTRGQTSGTLILADLDHFKEVNDAHGHHAGDATLQSFAAACTDAVRSTDLVGRYGGEEFIFLLPGADLDRAEDVTSQISRRLDAAHTGHDFRPPTVSYGLAGVKPGTKLDDLIADADTALYRAKSLGRNRAVRVDQT